LFVSYNEIKKHPWPSEVRSLVNTSEGGWDVLWRHEDNDRLFEVLRHLSEGGAVVRVDDEEARTPSERVQIARV